MIKKTGGQIMFEKFRDATQSLGPVMIKYQEGPWEDRDDSECWERSAQEVINKYVNDYGELAFDAFRDSNAPADLSWGDNPDAHLWDLAVDALQEWFMSDEGPIGRPPLPDDEPDDEKNIEPPPSEPLTFEEYVSVFHGRVRVEHCPETQMIGIFLYAPMDDRAEAMSGYGLWIDLPCAQAIARDLIQRVTCLARGERVAVLAGERDKEAGRIVWQTAPDECHTICTPGKIEKPK